MTSTVSTGAATDGQTASPSGEQLEIRHGDQRAVIVELGGGLRSYSVGARDVLDGYGVDQQATSGRGQVLVPWPNRIQDGRYAFDGHEHQLPLTEPEHGNAIHGLVRWVAWTIDERADDRVVMRHVIRPQPGYPFLVSVGIEYELSAEGLSVRTTATNLGPTACPFGAGAHPYLTLGTETVDVLALRIPARKVMVFDSRDLPVGTEAVDGTAYDFRTSRPIGDTVLDNAFADLARDDDGRARVLLRDPAGSELALWVDESYPFLMVFTGDPLPDVARRSIAVEPMTCPPNAFRSGDSLIRLEPEKFATGAWGIEPR
jgi:aldose 1-epimerase